MKYKIVFTDKDKQFLIFFTVEYSFAPSTMLKLLYLKHQTNWMLFRMKNFLVYLNVPDVFKEVGLHIFVLENHKVSEHVMWWEGVHQNGKKGDELMAHSLWWKDSFIHKFNKTLQTHFIFNRE